MIASFALSLRRFSCLVRLEAREVRGLTAFVLWLSLMITFGAALFASREGYVLTFGLEEALAIGVLAFAASMPVLADVVAGSEERSARRALASLPVSSGTVFVAQVCAALGAAALLYVCLCAGWVAAISVLGTANEAQVPVHGWGDFGGVAAALVQVGALVLPLAAVAVTCFVAQVSRHAGAATMAGWVTVAVLFSLHFDAGIMNLGTRFAHFPDFATKAASSPWTYIALLAAFGWACRLRGAANRSWFARTWRIAFVLGLSSSVAAGAVSYRAWRSHFYDFNDPDAYIWNAMPAVFGDSQSAVIHLVREDAHTLWRVDVETGSKQRIRQERMLELFQDAAQSPFYRGLERQKTAVIRERGRVDDVWHERVHEERWTSAFGGPPVTVLAMKVIPPRRRRPEIAYYFDVDKRLHSVNLQNGTDSALKYVIDGHTLGAEIDEDGRWLTWYADERFHAVELETGEHVTHQSEEPQGRVFPSFHQASLRSGPVLRTDYESSGPSHATIQNGEIVPLPLARRYTNLLDVDGERLLGLSRDNGVYLLGPDCEEVAVLREPTPGAPRR